MWSKFLISLSRSTGSTYGRSLQSQFSAGRIVDYVIDQLGIQIVTEYVRGHQLTESLPRFWFGFLPLNRWLKSTSLDSFNHTPTGFGAKTADGDNCWVVVCTFWQYILKIHKKYEKAKQLLIDLCQQNICLELISLIIF